VHAVAVQRGTVHVPSRSTPSHSSCTVARTWQYTGVSRLHRLLIGFISSVSRMYLGHTSAGSHSSEAVRRCSAYRASQPQMRAPK